MKELKTPEREQAYAEWLAGLPTGRDMNLTPFDTTGLLTLDGLQPFDTTGLATMPDCKAWTP